MSSRPVGYFALVLHAHLPYVIAHGKWPHGTDWLNEAAAETYIPILDVLNKLKEEGYSPRVTIGITPILLEQLSDDSFKDEFKGYLKIKIEAAEDDEKEFTRMGQRHLATLAKRWEDFYKGILSSFTERYREDLVGSFSRLQEEGHIEIITSAATHGYLPLLGQDTCVQAQIKAGLKTYQRHFGRPPAGIWLPECAYRPRYQWVSPVGRKGKGYLRKGVDEFLSENNIDYFIVDSHLLEGGKAIGVYLDRYEALRRLWGQFSRGYKPRPVDEKKTPHTTYLVGQEGKRPVAVFTRDPKTGLQVWSGEWGYPGDGWYLDFHKKRFPGGLRYWRITSSKCDLADKEEYYPERPEERIAEQSVHFKDLAKGILRDYNQRRGEVGVICAPFDAELFGHWWFEGPKWLYHILKKIEDDGEIGLITCREYIEKYPPTTVVSLPEGSWGEGGFHWIWLNKWTEWTWRHIYEAEEKMQALVGEFSENPDSRLQTILKQAARELLILESSDWQFLISTWSARDYAEMRVAEHYESFIRLTRLIERYGRGEQLDPVEWDFLKLCEERERPFPDLDLRWWARLEYPIK